jgi:hypothetical protein
VSADIYGFVEFDSIMDTTQSLGENAGNAIIGKGSGFAGSHKRLTFTPRNSRLGLKLKGPDSEQVHASAIVEMDFLGNQPPTATEAQLLTNAAFRIRHMAGKVETPYVDILAGQYWQLFGWQSYFHPATVEIQGLPGEVFGRAPQLRLSHAFKSEALSVEVAIAASRPPQRDGSQWAPDAQGGVRLLLNNWKGWHTPGAVSTSLDAGGIGVSGAFRRFNVNDMAAPTTSTNAKNAGGISVDALVPVIPGTAESRDFALTLNGSFVRGTGIADLYTGLTGGIASRVPANPTMAATAPTYNIDPGLVVYDAGGLLHTIDWQSFLVGAQLYLPGGLWLSGNFSRLSSPNMSDLANSITMAPNSMRISKWADGNLFWDLNKAVRFGGEVAWFNQIFVDNSTSTNWRFQGSMFYIF